MLVCNVSTLPRVLGKVVATDAADTAVFFDKAFGVLTATELKDIAAFSDRPVASGALTAIDLKDSAAFTGSVTGAATGPGTWTPANYATAPFVWFDAADAATVTQSAGATSQWNDKSGHNNNIAQATGTKQPTYNTAVYNGKNALTFDGGDSLTKTSGLTAAIGAGTIFIVAKPLNATNGWVYYGYTGAAIAGTCLLSKTTGRLQFVSNNYASWDPTDNVLLLLSGYLRTDKRVAFEGGVQKASNVTGSDANNVPTQISVGTDIPSVSPFFGDVCELIHVPGELSTADRQIFEGYLGWKWSASAAILDASHPYKIHGPDA